MRRKRSFLGRLSSALLATAVVTGGLVVSAATIGAGVATAESPVPSTISPIAQRTASQVTADALPTVQIDGIVWAQAIAGTGANAVVYAGGSFANARPAGAAPGTNLTPRGNLLAYDLSTGVLISSFAPVLNGQVLALAVSPDGTKLFVGGDFTTADGVRHNRLAAYSTSTGQLIATFRPNISGRVKSLLATNTAVYAGGQFAVANGNTVSRLAAFDTTSGALLNWLPTADDNVNAMVMTPDGSKIILGGAFKNINGSPAYGLAAVDPNTGALLPWAANSVVRDAGDGSGILSLSTDGTSIYGTGYVYGGAGGNLEGAFSADPVTGKINWIEDCHGDTYGSYPMGGALYTVSHAHQCSTIGGYPETVPKTGNMHHSLAFTTTATGTIGKNPFSSYTNWEGHSSPSLIDWFPDFSTANVSGAQQAAWSVTGNGQYVVEGGEFPTVNNVGQQGLVRFAVKPIAPAKQGVRVFGADAIPTLALMRSGSVRVSFSANWDRDDKTLTYKVVRNAAIATPVYTVTADSQFWNLPKLGFTDTGLVAGTTYTYRVYVSDSDGNNYAGDPVSITVPAAPPISRYAQDVLAAGATHYWRFGETSGTAAYDWAGSDDDTTVGKVTRGTAGAIIGDADGASTFDGKSSFAVDSTPVAAPNVFTVSAWFKTTTTSGGKIVGFGDSDSDNSSNYDRHIYMDKNGLVYFGVYDKTHTIVSTAKLNDGNWHQVIGTMTATGMSLYIDGKLVGTNSTNAGLAYSGYWRVGGDSTWSGSKFFAGTIDDVAIYPSALTIGQIRQQYTDSGRTFAGIVAPADSYGKAVYGDSPSLYYRLDDTSGATAADASGNGNSGTYSGGYTFGAASPVTGAGGTGVTFDGSKGTLSSSVQLDDPTVYSEELWFKTTTVKGGRLIGFSNKDHGSSSKYDRQVYMTNNGQLVFGTLTKQKSVATSTASYNDGGWHYLVATQGSDGMKLYVDNQLVATNPQTASDDYAGYWRIGGDKDWGGDSAYFGGTIDEAAVYLSVLSPTQIAGHFNSRAGVNHPPTGSFTSAVSKLGVAFTATAADSDGTIAGYAWNFGDGTVGTGSSVSHTYTAAGTYAVTLTVTDDGGAGTVITNQVVTVANAAPTASFLSTVSYLAVAFSGSGSADSDGTIKSYAWDYGDGSAVVTTTSPSSAHTYSASGVYTASLTVTDNDGASTTTTNPVTTVAPPSNLPPTASFTVNTSGLSATFAGTASTDSDGTIASYAWNYGDGSAAVTTTTPTSSYTYAAAGTYSVTLTVTDDKGATGSVTRSVLLTGPNVAIDAFDRTTATGWGAADVGGSWTTTGSASAFSVSAGVGSMKMATAGAGPSATLNSAAGANVNGAVDVTLSAAPVGGGTYISMAGRRVGSSDYRVTVRFQPTSSSITITRSVDGTATTLKQATIAGLTYNAGDTVRIRLQITGSGTSTISARAWKTSGAEPATWQLSTTDAEPTLQGAGGVALQSYLSGSSTAPVTAAFDNLMVTTNTTP